MSVKWYQALPAVLLFCLPLRFLPVYASELESAKEVLQAMSNASRKLDYQISFITVSKLGVEISRYTHILKDQRVMALLLQLDGPRKEIIQQGKQITFIEAGLQAFSLTGDYIVDALPEIAFSDFNQLSHYYDFMRVGRMRVADRNCEVIRIIAKDGTRYSYIVWIDEESRLLMRSELLDAGGEVLEQFRVVSFSFGHSVKGALPSLLQSKLLQNKLPAAPVYVEQQQGNFNWQPGWLPKGFKEISHQVRLLSDIKISAQSRLYSDGIFTFSINVIESSNNKSKGDRVALQQQLRQGRRTIYSEVLNNREVILIGELPPTTVKRIIKGVAWSATPNIQQTPPRK